MYVLVRNCEFGWYN